MERYICIHGHFYQPPRESPWLETVELQDSAYPYHDWNERITAECYGPNAFARILDGQGRIVKIVNNYAKISFNFGPTLLSWLEDKAPVIYAAVLRADRESQERFGGHGSALAQVYNHIILPLANRRDKVTQVAWGIRDFEDRFGRKPAGIWLAETAVDLETLDVLTELGIRFTILSPYQAQQVRAPGEEKWQEVAGGHIDPTRAYVQKLPSGRSINLFFYDGPIARAVAFERLLHRGESLAERLLFGFSNTRTWPQLVHIATDGESYGHHHPHGDMSLAYALEQIEKNPEIKLINYGQFLEKHPPTHEVNIIENTAWSCSHGVDRWRRDCGCSSGRPGWNQAWREPLRQAFDELRDGLACRFHKHASELVSDPWKARDDYSDVVLDRSADSVNRFVRDHASRELSHADLVRLLKLMEVERHALLMYTSCGWFFDDISGIETVQVMQYAGRALQLAQELFGDDVETALLAVLQKAKSNLAWQGDGRKVYEKYVKPNAIDWEKIAAHYAVSSLFEAYPAKAPIFCFTAEREDVQGFEAGKAKLVIGRVRLTSEITREQEVLAFGVLHFGDHNINGGVCKYQDEESYRELGKALADAFAKADFPEIIRLMDRGFGESTYSLRSLFRDEQRKITKQVLQPTAAEADTVYRRLYEQHLPTMRFLADLGVPLPRPFQAATEFVINSDLRLAYQDDEPNPAYIRNLLDEAARWHVSLDTQGLAYKLKKSMERMAERWQRQPADLAQLEALAAIVDLVRSLPFEVDLWQPQNTYYEMLQTVYPEFEARGLQGVEKARDWLARFLSLGEKLGVQVAEQKQHFAELGKAPTVADVVAAAVTGRRIPRATYRFQFTRDFPFAAARELVTYLDDLGISDCYASPILKARPGSMHGYDICDHGQLNPELGGSDAFNSLAAALQERGMGLVVDTVPNHMAVGHPSNGWWMDILENGPSSLYSTYFDIDWHPVNPNLNNKVLLPVLEDQYGSVLEAGKIRLAYEDGAFFFTYYDNKFPVEPRSYRAILEHRLAELEKSLAANNDYLQDLHSILTALSYLPLYTELAAEKIAERTREKEVIKRRIAGLAASSPAFLEALNATVQDFNGSAANPSSFDPLDRLLELQPYRMAFWRVAGEEINYRRFFDINDLAAIRVELPEVFAATHQLTFRLMAEGKITGLRIDHPDGLWDPSLYFRSLQEAYLVYGARTLLKPEHMPENLEQEVAAQLDARIAGDSNPQWPLYVVAEKILGENEPLPANWAVCGTTGYDFLNFVNGLFVNAGQREAIDAVYTQFIQQRPALKNLLVANQKMIMLVSMASEVTALAHQLDRISEGNRRYRDFTLNSLTFAIREIIAALEIYRTYITSLEPTSLRDRLFIEKAVETAKDTNPRTAEAIFDFIRDTLLLRNLHDFREEDRPRLLAWTMKFQQLTGPVLAKGLEDTTFYVFNRLASLNEVGGNPQTFGLSVADFHQQNEDRAQKWPHSMLASSTHDTKRSEDVRARLNVLSELPQEWQAALTRWSQLNAPKKTLIEGNAAPDNNEEYLLYQSLVGAWPAEPLTAGAMPRFRERIAAYMQKAIHEAKVHTSWVNPNHEHDAAVQAFVERLLPDTLDEPFLQDLVTFQKRLAYFGYFNSLAQTLLKLTGPGVPDFFQGSELWDFSLVDPDNRRPVDYQIRQAYLKELKEQVDKAGKELAPIIKDLLANMVDGKIKLYVIERVLNSRKDHEQLFRAGSYHRLAASEDKHDHVCAFTRYREDEELLVVVPRLIAGLTEGAEVPPMGSQVWGATWLSLPERGGKTYRNIFTGEAVKVTDKEGRVGIAVAALLRHFPVAVLCSPG
jgi:(1->4)-alpha-D-glucan 1-alpha-D-glucosylmutase